MPYCPTLARIAAAPAFIVALALSATALAQATSVKVIPRGKEALIGEMLGNEVRLPGGCAYHGANIDRSFVSGKYVCAGPVEGSIELRHANDPAIAGATQVVTTAQFKIVARGNLPPVLIEAITARVKEREGTFRWISVEAAGLGQVAVGPTPTMPTQTLTAEESDAVLAAMKLYNDGRFNEADAAFSAIARTNPHEGVLGMVVASIASTVPDPSVVAKLTAEADAHPDDPLAQFRAGVGAHYCGHHNLRVRAAKLDMYERSIRYLMRARPAYDFEPRVYVYLAVSHLRLGHQDEAEKLIEQAIPLAVNDPDVYYCRAEVFHRKDVKRAVADIEKYLEMGDALAGQGVKQNPEKHERVKRMHEKLLAVRDGRDQLATDDDLFDPGLYATTAPASSSPGGAQLGATFASPRNFGGIVVGIGALAGAAYLAASRRKRRG